MKQFHKTEDDSSSSFFLHKTDSNGSVLFHQSMRKQIMFIVFISVSTLVGTNIKIDALISFNKQEEFVFEFSIAGVSLSICINKLHFV